MADTTAQGLDYARRLYEDRGARARELAAQGRKIIGYLCCYTPVELMTALELVPYRIQGAVGRPLEHADQHLETIMCPYVRSCFDLAVSGEYDFLSGVVIPHTCDAMHRIYDIWKYHLKPPYSYCITVPHMTHAASFEYFRKEIEHLQKSLQGFAGRPSSAADLAAAIATHNRTRSLLRKLYELRKSDPPLISGVEITQVLVAGMTIPAEEYNGLLEEVILAVSGRRLEYETRPRLLIVGSEVDDLEMIRLIEDSGFWLVMDDVCTGSRPFMGDVEVSKGAAAGLADRYLGGITCPCTFRPGKIAERFGYLREYVRDWKVDGVVLFTIRFCDTYQLDMPELIAHLKDEGVPVLYIDTDYITIPTGQWRTRLQAFREMIQARTEQ